MKHKYIIALFVTLSFYCNGVAQFADTLAILHPYNIAPKQDSALKAKHQRNKYFYIGLNLGYCPPSISFPIHYFTDDEYFSASTPVYNATMSIDFIRFLNVGLAVTIQDATFIQTYSYGPEDLFMTNTSLHISAHINRNRKSFDHYIGIRAGYSYLGDQPNDPNGTNYALGGPSVTSFTYQLFYGVSFYGENAGFNLELGLGSPFLIQGGVVFRLKKKITTIKELLPHTQLTPSSL